MPGMGTRSAGTVDKQLDLILMLSHASHVLATELTARLGEIGISPRAHCVLSHALDQELSQIRLAEHCGMDKTTMVVTVDGLEREGLAERRPSSTDRRARIIAVTPAGRRLVQRAKRVVDEVYDNVLSTLPAREREGFVAGLARLVGERLATPMPCENAPRRRLP